MQSKQKSFISKKVALGAIILMFVNNSFAISENIVTAGFILNLNMNTKRIVPSLALEFAVWHFPEIYLKANEHPLNYGIDFGIESEIKAVRLYTEGQIMSDNIGISIGPLIEKPAGGKWRYGGQLSAWSFFDIFFGADLRFRRTGQDNFICAGFMGKCPIYLSEKIEIDFGPGD